MTLPKPCLTVTDGTSSPIDKGRDPQNSEDGGLVLIDVTAGGSEEEVFAASTQEEFDPAEAMFDWLKQCAEADLDKDTCLFTKTLDTLVNMDGPPEDDDITFPTRRRVLEEAEEGCHPELSEHDLRMIMIGSRADCSQVSIEYSDEVFDSMLGEMWSIFSSESCWEELCESPDIFVKLMFDHAVHCANVKFDVDECVVDQIFSMLFAGPVSYDDDYYYDDYDAYDDDYVTRRVLRSLQDVVNGDGTADCVVVDEVDLAFFASFVLMDAQGRCAELGLSITLEDITKASTDLVKLFGSPHCWGDAHACPDYDDDTHADDDVFGPNQDTVGDGNITPIVANGTIISPTEPTSLSPAGDADDDANALSDDEQSDEADEDDSVGSITNTSTFDEQSFENGDDGVSFNNGTTTEVPDDDEATKEDLPSSSTQDENADTNQTSIDGGINAASSTDGDINGIVTSGGEGNGTVSDEDDQFSTSGTTPTSNSSTLENTTTPSPPDNTRGGIFTTGESCDVGPRSDSIFERSIEMPYFYIIETIVLEGVVDEIESLVHLMMCINGVDRRLSVESSEEGIEIVAVESSPKDVVSTECKFLGI